MEIWGGNYVDSIFGIGYLFVQEQCKLLLWQFLYTTRYISRFNIVIHAHILNHIRLLVMGMY